MPDPQDFCQHCHQPFDRETSTARQWLTFCSRSCEAPRAVFVHRNRPGRHMAFKETRLARLRRAVRRFVTGDKA